VLDCVLQRSASIFFEIFGLFSHGAGGVWAPAGVSETQILLSEFETATATMSAVTTTRH